MIANYDSAQMANRVTEERAEAVRRAIADICAKWRAEHDGKDPSTELQGEWFGVTQQKMSDFKKNPTVGEKLADGVANYLGTTPDGLIRTYLQEEREVRANDLPGWKEAVRQARSEAGALGESFLWDAAGHVVLPVAPARATPALAHDIAYLLTKYARGSGFIRKAK